MISAHPKQRRQLEKNSLFLLWRDAPGGGRQGLLCMAVACADRACPCTDVQIRGVLVDDGLVSAEVTDRGLAMKRARVPAVERKVTALVDVDTGEVRPAEAGMGDEVLYSWLPGEMDGELLSHLAGVRASARGVARDEGAWKRQSWAGVKPGEMLRWAELFDDGRRDAYKLGEATYYVEDLYCVTPGCSCTEMQLLVGERRAGEEGASEIGRVVVDTTTGEATKIGAVAGREELVDKLWEGFRARHGARARVAERAARMKRLGPEIFGLSQRSTASNPTGAGRNDPCPCGSGKKYKRCCL